MKGQDDIRGLQLTLGLYVVIFAMKRRSQIEGTGSNCMIQALDAHPLFHRSMLL